MKSLIRVIVMILIPIAFVSFTALAETMYVTDVLKINVREGSGVDYKAVGVVESGQEVEVISTNGEWAKVLLRNGIEGWLNSKYLTSFRSGSTDLKKLQEKEALLNNQNTALKNENIQLKDELKNTGIQLAESMQALSVTTKSFETLKENSNNYIELENKYNEAKKRLTSQKNKIDDLEEENIRLLRQQNVIWLLAGAGILLVGFIIGYNARRDKSRSSIF
jgi:SH3 domain protein